MPQMKFLCLHGLGSNANIFESQLGSLITELSTNHDAEFHFIDGIFPQPAGPGIAGLYDPPYSGYFRGDILQQAHDLLSLAQALRDPAYKDSVQEAYQLLYDVLSEDGPFDGILGFSHGATLAMMFLTQHVEKNPLESPWSLVGCAVFIAGPSPLAGDGRRMTAREGEGGGKVLGIPTVHVVGREDELYEDALKMYGLCEEESKVLVEHEKGHVIPRDGETVGRMARAIRGLRRKMVNI